MIVKYKRYEVWHNKRTYFVYVPEGIKNSIYTLDWADWWYGTFIRGSRKGMQILTAGFALLGFNPYAIVYYPVGGDMIPEGIDVNPENGKYDIVFKTNRTHFKDKDWKEIRNKLNHSPCTTYKFDCNSTRIQTYFEKKVKDLRKVPDDKMLKSAGANVWLAVGTAFFVYPRYYYQQEAASLIEEINTLGGVYHENFDEWIPHLAGFCYGGYERNKYTYEKPGLTLNLEVYDLNEINHIQKKKVKLVKHKTKRKQPEELSSG